MQDGLGKARGTAAEVDSSQIVVGEQDAGLFGGEVVQMVFDVDGEIRADLPGEVHMAHTGQLIGDFLHTADEFLAEDELVHFRQIQAVLDLVSGVAVIQGHGDGAGLQHAEIDGQPFEAVHHEDGHLVALADPGVHEHVRESVRAFVELLPRDLAAVELRGIGFDKVEFQPAAFMFLAVDGIHFDQGNVVAVQPRVPCQIFGNGHKNHLRRIGSFYSLAAQQGEGRESQL